VLLIVNSLHKCGSTWFHNFLVNCLAALGHPTPHAAIQDYPVRLNAWGNPGAIDGPNLETLLAAARGQTFAIKAHRPPNKALLTALETGAARTIFLIRHPTSIVRSALAFGDHCRTHPELEPDSPYAAIFDAEQAADFVAPSIDWAKEWLGSGARGIVTRYEEIFSSEASLLQVANQLHPDVARVSKAVSRRMMPDRLSADDRKRYRVNLIQRPELSSAVIDRCEGWARQMGYS
jgi:hypothetical protein